MVLLALSKLPLGEAVEFVIDWLVSNLSVVFDAISDALDIATDKMEDGLLFLPPIAVIVIFSLLIWLISSKKIALFSFVGLLLVYNLGLWTTLVETFILIFIAVVLALIIGIPLGIWMTRNKAVREIVRPVMDFMQTMPPFVYLIPAVMLFGIGTVPGLFSTIIFAVPPPVRLTYLGITQVPSDVKEMARAFGASDFKVLTKVELPLSMPSIMAGVNQCIMLGISMVVIASMIGAGGLGSKVLWAVNKLDIASGFEAGLAIVILAMVLDSVSRQMGGTQDTLLVRLLRRLRRPSLKLDIAPVKVGGEEALNAIEKGR
ncbi:MAG: proline/glycine betaine ABC transporter permease [Dehalococcoidales bacterium]|nr:proline/glycine betaine ABC transporter permease [Dehalococcoidales bacterium]